MGVIFQLRAQDDRVEIAATWPEREGRTLDDVNAQVRHPALGFALRAAAFAAVGDNGRARDAIGSSRASVDDHVVGHVTDLAPAVADALRRVADRGGDLAADLRGLADLLDP